MNRRESEEHVTSAAPDHSEGTPTPEPSSSTLAHLLEQAIALYIHEDNLAWTKLQRFFYLNAALIGLVVLTLEYSSQSSGLIDRAASVVIYAVPLVGATISAVFLISLRSSCHYLGVRALAAKRVGNRLKARGYPEILLDEEDDESSTVRWVFKRLPEACLVVWVLVFVVALAT